MDHLATDEPGVGRGPLLFGHHRRLQQLWKEFLIRVAHLVDAKEPENACIGGEGESLTVMVRSEPGPATNGRLRL